MKKILSYDVNGDSVDNLVQWDKNQYVYIQQVRSDFLPTLQCFHSKIPECSFVFEGNITQSANQMLKIKIPNQMLERSGWLSLFIFYDDPSPEGSDTTRFVVDLMIKHKPKPTTYTPDFDNPDKVRPISREEYSSLVTHMDTLDNTINESSGTGLLTLQNENINYSVIQTNPAIYSQWGKVIVIDATIKLTLADENHPVLMFKLPNVPVNKNATETLVFNKSGNNPLRIGVTRYQNEWYLFNQGGKASDLENEYYDIHYVYISE